MDSQGPDVKVRGNASTIYEKYTTLARDAKMSGNRVKAENLLQHAEHYLRVMNVQEAAKREAQEAREKAEAERAAKRAERGETQGDEDGNENRNSRRNHRNNRRDRDENRKLDETVEGLAKKRMQMTHPKKRLKPPSKINPKRGLDALVYSLHLEHTRSIPISNRKGA